MLRRFVVVVGLGAMLGAAMPAPGAGQEPWTMSERGVVTRQDVHPAGPPPNPLRHAPDELLVKLRPALPSAAAARALATVPARATKRFRSVEHLYHVKLAPGVALHQALRALRRHPDVVYAEPNFVVEALLLPNDPSLGSQWGLIGPAGIRAPQAWDMTVGSSSVVIAVLDTGVDSTHEDLADNIHRNEAECFANGLDDDGNGVVDDCHGLNALTGGGDPRDDNGHGTHVAGIIGARGSNLTGISGVAWDVKILPCKFLDANGNGDTAGAIACLDYVAVMKDRGLDIVATNNSWGGGLFSQALADAIAAQRDRGILFVAAAGNAGANNDVVRTYPCSYEIANVVCVAATDENDALAPFSNYGRGTVHIGAPGVNILSTLPGNTYGYLSGTSMATPHVTGTLALLAAGWPGQSWQEHKNMLFSGGAPTPALAETTLIGRRLDAGTALACNGPQLLRRLRPATTQVRVAGPIRIEVANIYCFAPVFDPGVAILQTGEQLSLSDDGQGGDQAAGDGVFTTVWNPPTQAGPWDIGFPDGSIVHVAVDPLLKPGFPVQTFHGAGSYQGGQGLHALVGNIDGAPDLEIVVTGLAQGPLYAFKANGQPVPGWPVFDPVGAAYPALGQLTAGSAALEVVSGHFASRAGLAARDGSGVPLPGWPRTSASYVATPPTLADVDGDGVDEIFTEEEDWHLHAYRADGTILTGWPTAGFIGGQERHTPAVADLDGDGRVDILTASGSMSPGGVTLLAHRDDGSLLVGFPISFNGHVNSFPVIGDVDGDGQPDIVVAGRIGADAGAYVFSAAGVLKRTMTAVGTVFFGTAIALADLDGDGVPEIVMQTNSALNVWKGNGTVLPGWPRALPPGTSLGHASPVVGDVDGDGQPEIVTVVTGGSLLVYRRDGALLPGFPLTIAGLGEGGVPAIADIDGDGRNDIIVVGDFWNGQSGYYDKVWAFDLGGPAPHGPILWGQFMGGPKHQGRYGPAVVVTGSLLSVSRTGAGTGTVTSSPIGIACGSDCSERFVNGTVVTLTATPAAGSLFAGWSGACAGQPNPCTLTIDGPLSVTASFDATATLTVVRAGGGAGTVTSSPAGIDCGTDCSETYASGTAVTLTATPGASSVFSGWSGACSGTASTCTLTLTSSQQATATFTATWPLTVTLDGQGSVVSSPAGLSCPASCSANFTSATSVTLTATPAAGWQFAGWSGACTGTSTCTVNVTAATNVTATFRQIVYTLSVSTTAGGTVTSTPAGITCGTECSADFASGTGVTLTATASPGFVFTGWSGACSGTSATCSLTMTSTLSASATFTPMWALTVTRAGAGNGIVTSAPAGIDCGATCSATYVNATSVTLTATAAADSAFTGWSGACSGSAPTCTVTMTQARSVTASFTPLHTLTVGTSGSGSVASSPSGIACPGDCTETYPDGTVVTLTATPAAGFAFAAWTGACAGSAATCALTLTTTTSTTASFAPAVTLTVSLTGNGTGRVTSTPAGIDCGADCSEIYAQGRVVTLTATPLNGSTFQSWSGACSGSAPTCTVTMSAATAVTARFRK